MVVISKVGVVSGLSLFFLVLELNLKGFWFSNWYIFV